MKNIKNISIIVVLIIMLFLFFTKCKSNIIKGLGGYTEQTTTVIIDSTYIIGKIDTLDFIKKYREIYGRDTIEKPVIVYKWKDRKDNIHEQVKKFNNIIKDSLIEGNIEVTNNFFGDLLEVKLDYTPLFPKYITRTDTLIINKKVTNILANPLKSKIGVGIGLTDLYYPSINVNILTKKNWDFEVNYTKPDLIIKDPLIKRGYVGFILQNISNDYIKSITEDIAFALGDQFNDTLRQSIKNSIIDYRALLIRQDLERGFISPQHYLQSFCINMITTDSSECSGLESGKTILVSKQELPKTIRAKTTHISGFNFVGSVDRYKSYEYTTKQGINNKKELPFQKSNTILYTIINNRLYILNNVRPCKVLLEGIIDDPRDIEDCNNPTVFRDNIPFSCPSDLLVGIKNSIKKEYFPKLIEDGKEINIAKDGVE